MFRFLHAADIHLDSPLKGLEVYEDAPVDEIRGATRRAFDNLIDLAVEEEVGFVLLAGDLYDGDWKDYNTGLFFVDRMGRLRKANIPVFIVSGNHDAASQINKALPLPENVTLFPTRKPTTVLLENLGVAIHGQGYSSRAVLDNIAAGYPQRDPHYFNIGLLHTALNGRPGHEPYAPCSPDDLRSKGYDYWALGHIHQREVVSRDPWIVFPGNIQGRHVQETGTKGATLVTLEEGQVTQVEHRELDVLRWALCQVNLSECETTGAVSEQVRLAMEREQNRADGRTLAVRLVLEGQCPVHARLFDRSVQLTEEFRGLAAGLGDVWLEKVLFRTHRKTSLEAILGEDTPLTGLLEAVENLELGKGRILELVPEIETLRSRLPSEFLEGEDLFSPGEPELLDEIREEIKELLVAKLVRHGGEV
jgi:DNA repair exonuclease SbcCD nuclease subunit